APSGTSAATCRPALGCVILSTGGPPDTHGGSAGPGRPADWTPMKNKWLQISLSVLSLGLAVLLVVYLPQIVRTLTGNPVSWSEIGAQFAALGAGEIALMTALWLLSLLAYTFVLTNSLP